MTRALVAHSLRRVTRALGAHPPRYVTGALGAHPPRRVTRVLGNTVAAELIKIRSLPAAVAAMLGTVVAGVVLAAALAASAPEGADAARVMIQVMALLQIGPILLAVVVASSEYAGRQITTTLVATPNRLLLLGGKGIAYLLGAAVTGFTAVGGGVTAAWITLAARGIGRPFDPWPLIGAVLYLVLIGLLGLAVTIQLRSLIPPLVAMLALVLIVSPLLAEYTEHARWLPDRAGRLLYLPDTDPPLTPGTGALILLAWIVVVGAVASVTFARRDA